MESSHDLAARPTVSAQELCMTAVMTALVFLATFVPHIPIPLGYAHLGDAVIFLFALLLRRRDALFAACVGSALSDVLGGFALWALPTLVIKFLMVEVVCCVAGSAPGTARTAAAFLAYTAFGALLYASVAAGLASAPGLLMEGVVNTAVALLVLPALRRLRH